MPVANTFYKSLFHSSTHQNGIRELNIRSHKREKQPSYMGKIPNLSPRMSFPRARESILRLDLLFSTKMKIWGSEENLIFFKNHCSISCL